MADDTPETVGRRIARARKRADLTQIGLAQRSNYSRGHLGQVEAGHKMATPAFVTAVASALGVDPAEIYGQPYRMHGHDDQVHSAIPELRRVLIYVELGPDMDAPPRSLDTLAAEVATMRGLMSQAKLTTIGGKLPAVIEELSYWAHANPSPYAWALLCRALRDAVSLTRRLGYTGDALALVDRSADAARRAEDPHLPHVVTLARALLLMGMNQHQPALTLLDRAAAAIDESRPDAGEVAGAIGLRSAIIAARAAQGSSSRQGRAWDYFEQAAEIIRPGVGAPTHGLEVTPANAAIHGAAVAAEIGDLDEAARRDHDIGDRTLTALPPERRAHHEIDMSRVHLETGNVGKAIERLDSADRIAPQMVTFHPTARSVVAHLVDARRTLPEPLRRLHTRMSA